MFSTRANKLTSWLGRVVIVATSTIFIGQGCATYQAEYDDETAPYGQGEQVLDAYGRWVVVEPYGQCWQPRVSNRWAPFIDGQWAYTDQGWVWDSNEPYGWLVYHYGSWDFRADLGWYWVPSDVWSPACVQWAEFGDYIAWSPLPPPGVIRSGPWVPESQRFWTVVELKHFDASNVSRHRVVKRVPDLSIGKEIHSGNPPDRNVIERVTKRKVNLMSIKREQVKVNSQPRERVILHRATKGSSDDHRQPDSRAKNADDKRTEGKDRESSPYRNGTRGHQKSDPSDSSKAAPPQR